MSATDPERRELSGKVALLAAEQARLSLASAAARVCAHTATWTTSSSSSGIREWQQGVCSSCGAYAIYHDGSWRFSDPPTRVLELAAERDRLTREVERLRVALRTISIRRPAQDAAAAAFYRCREDAREALREPAPAARKAGAGG